MAVVNNYKLAEDMFMKGYTQVECVDELGRFKICTNKKQAKRFFRAFPKSARV